MNRRIVAMILALVVVTGAACSSDKDSTAGRSATTTTTPSPAGSDTGGGAIESTTPPPSPAGDDTEAVKAAYLHFWTVVDEYGKRTGRFDPVDAKTTLGAIATGGEYDHLFDMFQLNRIKGLVYRDGDTPDEFAPVITIESATRASVKDCRTDKGGIYRESDGQRIDTPTEGRRLFEVILVKEDSQWKVSSVGGKAGAEDPPCTV
ncbi:MAG: hypothetical protein AB1679_14910 [Actinomycetota bacterium]